MTNLMQQLQQWADEGLYDWENTTFDWTLIERHKRCLFEQVEYVLEGTIQVWRPVEHYPPPENTILCLGRGVRIGNVEEKEGGYWIPTPESTYTNAVKITHWQPLPAWMPLPKYVKEIK